MPCVSEGRGFQRIICISRPAFYRFAFFSHLCNFSTTMVFFFEFSQIFLILLVNFRCRMSKITTCFAETSNTIGLVGKSWINKRKTCTWLWKSRGQTSQNSTRRKNIPFRERKKEDMLFSSPNMTYYFSASRFAGFCESNFAKFARNFGFSKIVLIQLGPESDWVDAALVGKSHGIFFAVILRVKKLIFFFSFFGNRLVSFYPRVYKNKSLFENFQEGFSATLLSDTKYQNSNKESELGDSIRIKVRWDCFFKSDFFWEENPLVL